MLSAFWVVALLAAPEADVPTLPSYFIEAKLCRVKGAPPPELGIPQEESKSRLDGKPAGEAPFRLFTEADCQVGDVRLLMKEGLLEWNGDRSHPDLELLTAPRVTIGPRKTRSERSNGAPWIEELFQTAITPELQAVYNRLMSPRTVPGADQEYTPFCLADVARGPIPYLEHERSDIYRLNPGTVQSLGAALAGNVFPLEDGSIDFLLLFRFNALRRRTPLEGVSLDVGPPQFEEITAASDMRLIPGHWAGFVWPKGQSPASSGESYFLFLKAEPKSDYADGPEYAVETKVIRLEENTARMLVPTLVPLDGAQKLLGEAYVFGQVELPCDWNIRKPDVAPVATGQVTVICEFDSLIAFLNGLKASKQAEVIAEPHMTLPGMDLPWDMRHKYIVSKSVLTIDLQKPIQIEELLDPFDARVRKVVEDQNASSASTGLLVDLKPDPGKAFESGQVVSVAASRSNAPGGVDLDFAFFWRGQTRDTVLNWFRQRNPASYADSAAFRYRFTLPPDGWLGFLCKTEPAQARLLVLVRISDVTGKTARFYEAPATGGSTQDSVVGKGVQ